MGRPLIHQSLQMKFYLFCVLSLLAGCSGHSNSAGAVGKQPLSINQLILIALKDSLIVDYSAANSQEKRQLILQEYQARLEDFLMHRPMDSMTVTIDEVVVNGRTVTTTSHFSNIQFQYGLTFSGTRSPGMDSVYDFMKGLRQGGDTLVNFSYTGACQVNRPDSGNIPVFKIYAFPVPLQYTRK